MKRRHSFAALAIGLSLVAAACGSDDDKTSSTTASTAAPTTTAAAGGDTTVASSTADTTEATTADSTEDTSADTTEATTDTTADSTADTTDEGASGGTVRIGVEQEWDCMDWMGSCGGSTYGSWAGLFFTSTRPYDFAKDDDGVWSYTPSILLDGDPTSEMVDGKQTVTYTINPDAVWNDGEPITSTDFKYTWDQVVNGTDIYDTSVFRDVESVDDSDPKTAVLTFSTVNASWQDLYESYGIYPSHILEGKDRNTEAKDGYTWSAGPFQLVEWNKGVGATFEVNPNYWGDKPKIDRIEETFFADTAAEFAAFKAGEVDTIGPQPQLDAIDAINAGGLPGSSVVDGQTGNVEALWINNAAAPFDDLAVRQAFAYAIDRDAIVNKLFGGIGVTTAVNSLNPPITAKYSNQEAFSNYKLDLDKVEEIMTGAGYAKDGDGIWAKDGTQVSFTIQSTAGNKRRELTEQVVQQQLADAGFKMDIQNQKAGDLFGQILPAGDFQVALYAQTATTLNPGLSTTQLSTNIPTEENGNSGNNWTRTNVPELDPLLIKVDTESDPDARAAAAKEADDILAENMVTLPLDPLPNIGMYGDNISGDFSVDVIKGPWWNIATWTVES